MRIRLSCNAAGDLRLQLLRDKRAVKPAVERSDANLVCSSKVQEMTTSNGASGRVGFGLLASHNCFGKDARRTIREAGAVIDRQPRKNTVFLTGTLPGSAESAYIALASWSSWVIQTTLQWINDNVKTARVCGVWEYQKRGALHIHLVVNCSSEGEAEALKLNWKARWIKTLDGVASRSSVDVYQRLEGQSWRHQKFVTRTDAQTVEKSVGNYLAKYLSKGCQTTRRACYYPPARWWFCNRLLRQEVQDNRLESTVSQLPLNTALDLFERCGGFLAGRTSLAFAYLCPFDFLQKGLVALLKPIQASLDFDYISTLLKTLQGCDKNLTKGWIESPHLVANLFGGRVVYG